MTYNNSSSIKTPLINAVIELNKKLLAVSTQIPNGKKKRVKKTNLLSDPELAEVLQVSGVEVKMSANLRHTYFDQVLKNGATLFTYAMRQLRGGKDYVKRSVELVEDIQATSYLVSTLGGISVRKMAEIDFICDNIATQIYAIGNGQNH